MSAFANLKWAYGKCIEEINKRPSTDMTAPSGYIILDNGKKAQVQVTVTTNVDDFIPSPDDEESFNNHLQKQILEQQPIPQDINKWIEDEAEKEEIYEPKYGGKDHSGYDTKMLYEVNYERSECFEKGAKAMYQLLLPELQQLRETIVRLKEELAECQQTTKRVAEKGLEIIEQQKETIEELKKMNDSLIRQNHIFVNGFEKQAAKIESLKQENEGLKGNP